MPDRPAPRRDRRLLRPLLLAAGLLCTALAIVGLFLPLLPTVPLLLLASACFARSSARFHARLHSHPRLGPLLRDFSAGQGIPLRAKLVALAALWISIPVSVLFFVPLLPVRILLIAIGLGVTIYLLRLPVAGTDSD